MDRPKHDGKSDEGFAVPVTNWFAGLAVWLVMFFACVFLPRAFFKLVSFLMSF